VSTTAQLKIQGFKCETGGGGIKPGLDQEIVVACGETFYNQEILNGMDF
jgi:hypothetical protein